MPVKLFPHGIFQAVVLFTFAAQASLYPTILWRFLRPAICCNSTARFPNEIHLGCGFPKLHLCSMRCKVGQSKVGFLYCYFGIRPDASAFIIQEMFLPEDDFSRRAADMEENRNRRREERKKKDRERDKTAFCQMIQFCTPSSPKQLQLSHQTRFSGHFHITLRLKG